MQSIGNRQHDVEQTKANVLQTFVHLVAYHYGGILRLHAGLVVLCKSADIRIKQCRYKASSGFCSGGIVRQKPLPCSPYLIFYIEGGSAPLEDGCYLCNFSSV